MINYNLVVYIGVSLIALIFILFIRNEMKKSRLDREEFKKQQGLKESFDRNKLSGGYIKK
jgi:hypothetical protein|tara:strand:+ start:501 stop:680 length:180 start_codon:yes stop_codon:yes gene_type:complete